MLSVKKLETTLYKVRGLVGHAHFNHSTIALADIQKEMNMYLIRMLRLGGDQHSKLAKYCTRIKRQ